MEVTKNNKIVLAGKHNFMDGLWDVSLTTAVPSHQSPSPTATSATQVANVIIRKKANNQRSCKYLHTACGSPPISTFLKAIKDGLLQSWPGIDLIKESDLSPTIATAKSHLDQQQKNLQSTKLPSPPVTAAASPAQPHAPQSNNDNTPTNQSAQSQSLEHDLLPTHGPVNRTQECFTIINQFDKKHIQTLPVVTRTSLCEETNTS